MDHFQILMRINIVCIHRNHTNGIPSTHTHTHTHTHYGGTEHITRKGNREINTHAYTVVEIPMSIE